MTGSSRRVVALAALLATVAGLALIWGWSEMRRPWAGWSGEAVVVELDPGLDAGTMLEKLSAAGVVRRPHLARAWLKLRGGAATLQAGEYRFDRPVSPIEVLEMLRRGEVLLHAVTLPEGLDREEVARRLEQAGFGSTEALQAAFDDPGPILEWDDLATDLEGYLFPDTYHLPRNASAGEISTALVQRFLEVVGENYADRAAAVGLTVREAVTLASLIEKETSVPEERPRISRVFHNRLQRGMRLQCDPTVIFALRREGHRIDRLLGTHLEFDSPYNTYVVTGLPPGPICSPGAKSLEAAVSPSPGGELYFVAAPRGGHTFSEDLAGHRAAVRAWRSHQRSVQ